MIPGQPRIGRWTRSRRIQQAADRDDLPDDARAAVADALARIEAGAPVHPIFEEVRALIDDPARRRDAELDRLAQEAVARAKNRPRRTKNPCRSRTGRADCVDGSIVRRDLGRAH